MRVELICVEKGPPSLWVVATIKVDREGRELPPFLLCSPVRKPVAVRIYAVAAEVAPHIKPEP